MARGIDENDLALVMNDGIGANVLGDAAGFAIGHLGFADGVEDRGLTVIDVAHNGDDGRAAHHVGIDLGVGDVGDSLFFEGRLAGDGAEQRGDLRCELGVEGLVDGGEDLLREELGDDLARLEAHLFGDFLHRHAFGDHDVLIGGDDLGFLAAIS